MIHYNIKINIFWKDLEYQGDQSEYEKEENLTVRLSKPVNTVPVNDYCQIYCTLGGQSAGDGRA